RAPWKRVIVMFAGPFMNLILSFGLYLVLFMVIGLQIAVPSIGSVSQCVVAAGKPTDSCPADAPASPAAAAGLRAGDTILSFGGDQISSYAQLQADIRKSPGQTVPIVVERGGQQLTLSATLTSNTVTKVDKDGYPVKGETVTAGFLGFAPAVGVDHLSLGESIDEMAVNAKHGVSALIALPGKIPGLWHAIVSDDPRQADSPIGMVGAARVGG
ncbi:M50 family metallopeptidase, partial [Kitasatospora nipponensis]|uniref:M50 family metallopeptidase n=1 Tax=Kitasatospora nipponensis TaxID=258049 RepID=UPI0031CE1908